jgi:2-amino-4-hydroxy-6-hydroxymethyldihydropteridine diphosphokinase
MPENIYYLSLGSNIGDRETYLREAIARLRALGSIVSISSFYETEPVEVTAQAWFLNCAVGLESNTAPEQLMAAILEIEQQMGRQRVQRKGPRTIDIDILLCGDAVINTSTLKIPHPAMQQRRFVLEPLAEIAPHVVHPLFKRTIQELLDALPKGQTVRRGPVNTTLTTDA